MNSIRIDYKNNSDPGCFGPGESVEGYLNGTMCGIEAYDGGEMISTYYFGESKTATADGLTYSSEKISRILDLETLTGKSLFNKDLEIKAFTSYFRDNEQIQKVYSDTSLILRINPV